MRLRVLVLAAALGACVPQPNPVPPTPDGPDGSRWPEDASLPPLGTTAAACAAMAFVGCPEGRETPEHQTCEQVFEPVRRFPGLEFDAVGIAQCRDITCMRAHNVKCGGK